MDLSISSDNDCDFKNGCMNDASSVTSIVVQQRGDFKTSLQFSRKADAKTDGNFTLKEQTQTPCLCLEDR